MEISSNGIDLIKSFEGCRLTAYKPVKSEKYYTIGYGHYGADVKKDSVITKETALELLKKDLEKFENAVNNCVNVPLNQNQFDALVSFAFNCGCEALKNSTLLKCLNNGDYEESAKQFKNWTKDSNGIILSGLVKRRNAEKSLFLTKTKNPQLPYFVQTTCDLNIRSGAGTNYKINDLAKRGTFLKVWAIKTVDSAKWGKNESGFFNLAYTKII